MKTLSFGTLLVALISFLGPAAHAGDQEDATAAAQSILKSLQDKEFAKLWDSQTSDNFKQSMTRDSFLANMTMGRSQLGEAGKSKFIDMAYSQADPGTGFEGEIYAFNFLNSYSAGDFYERIVVVKDGDGKFRMAGLWGTPAGQ